MNLDSRLADLEEATIEPPDDKHVPPIEPHDDKPANEPHDDKPAIEPHDDKLAIEPHDTNQ